MSVSPESNTLAFSSEVTPLVRSPLLSISPMVSVYPRLHGRKEEPAKERRSWVSLCEEEAVTEVRVGMKKGEVYLSSTPLSEQPE